MKKRIQVTGAVLTRNGLILAAQRGKSKNQGGLWEFPGGKIEPGETPEEALQRELHEELRCDANVGEFIATTEFEYDFGIVELSTYFCTLNGSEPQLTEHEQIKWLHASELTQLEWAPADIPTVKLLENSTLQIN